MSVNVETVAGPRAYPTGVAWSNDDGRLQIEDDRDRVIAEHAPGSWHRVHLVEEGGKP